MLDLSPVWVSFVQGCGRQDTPLVCMYGLQRIDLFLICLGAGGFTITCCLYITDDVFADCGMAAMLLLFTCNTMTLSALLQKKQCRIWHWTARICVFPYLLKISGFITVNALQQTCQTAGLWAVWGWFEYSFGLLGKLFKINYEYSPKIIANKTETLQCIWS